MQENEYKFENEIEKNYYMSIGCGPHSEMNPEDFETSKEIVERMPFSVSTYDSGTKEQPELKNQHTKDCTCSYCDPSSPIYQTKGKDYVGSEDALLEHDKDCTCSYCRPSAPIYIDRGGDQLGKVEPEIISLNQFSSKEEEREYLEEQGANYTVLDDEPPTDTKSFSDMYNFWKTNLAEDLEKEYTAASKKDMEPLWEKRLNAAKKADFEGYVEEYWKSQLKSANNGRIHWSPPKTKLVVVYVGSGSQNKWDIMINKYKPICTELEETMPQCKAILIPDVGAQEGQIRIETHDLS